MKYHPFYCEENVWHLCAQREDDARVALISNIGHQVALWGQKASEDPAMPVVWDYHVVLLTQADDSWQVWDLDTRLGAPVDALSYLHVTFLGVSQVPVEFHPMFRLLPAAEYRRLFTSDRRHMRRADGSYVHPPPPWPPIGEGSTLGRLTDLTDPFAGEVVDLDGLRNRL